MKLKAYYKAIIPKNPDKFKIEYDRKSKGRPAWIKIEGLPKKVRFIRIFISKKGKEGVRLQSYRTYIIDGFFLPIDYTSEEMEKFYDKWARDYDEFIQAGGKGKAGQNIIAVKFMLKKIKKYIKRGSLLDLGAGTGLITEMFVKEGFYPATLVDYSQGMLNQAKKRENLRGCKFIKVDIRKINLGKKFDLIISFFAFASSSYFKREELENILLIVNRHLNKNGIFAVLGHFATKDFEKNFKKFESGIYDLSTKKRFYTDYFIGGKK